MPPLRLEYAPIAKLDLDNVFAYTVARWGHEQAFHYSEELIEVIQALAEFPNLGRDRSDLRAGLRSIVVAQHIVMYQVFDDRVRIGRVLHERENAAKALDEMDSD